MDEEDQQECHFIPINRKYEAKQRLLRKTFSPWRNNTNRYTNSYKSSEHQESLGKLFAVHKYALMYAKGMLRSRIQHVLNPHRPPKIRGTQMDMSCSTFIALFDTQNTIHKHYFSRLKKRYARIVVHNAEQLSYLLGDNWYKRKWVDTKDGNIITNHMEIIFRSQDEVSRKLT